MTLYDYVLMITITLMVNLARPFAMADDDDVCYETVKQATSEMVNHRDGDRITYEIGIDLDPIQYICRPRNWHRYYASVLTCDGVSYGGRSVNVAEKQCGENCHSYLITPIAVDCILLKCERGNSTLTTECDVYININETPSTVQSTESLAIGSSEKLETANNNDNSTFVAMYIIVSGIAAMTIIGVTIYLCYKVSHCRGRPPDKNTPVEHQHGTLNEVVVHDAGKKVADPEKEENNMTSTDLTTSTQVYRVIKPRSTTQRGCELETSNYREYDEEAMRGSVKPDSIILGETSDKPVERYGQETDENSNAYYFSTMTGKKHHPSGNGNPTVKTVLDDKEIKKLNWV